MEGTAQIQHNTKTFRILKHFDVAVRFVHSGSVAHEAGRRGQSWILPDWNSTLSSLECVLEVIRTP